MLDEAAEELDEFSRGAHRGVLGEEAAQVHVCRRRGKGGESGGGVLTSAARQRGGDLPEFLSAKPLAIELFRERGVRVSLGSGLAGATKAERGSGFATREGQGERGRDGPEREELGAGRHLGGELFEVLAGEFFRLVLVWLGDDRGDEGGLEVVGEVARMEVSGRVARRGRRGERVGRARCRCRWWW